MASLPPGKALVSDLSGNVTASNVTSEELGRLSGVLQNVQQALELKQDKLQGPAVDSAHTVDRVVVTATDGRLVTSTTSASLLTRLPLLDTGTDPLSTVLAGKQDALVFDAPLSVVGGHLQIPPASASNGGCLTAAQYIALSGKQDALPVADASHSGILSSADWTSFNSKSPAIVGGASSVVSQNLTANKVLISTAQGKIGASTLAAGALDTLATARSDLQVQIDGKQDAITGAATSALTSNFSASKVVQTDGSGKLQASLVGSDKLAYLANVSSDLQTQLGTKQNTITGSCATTANSNLSTNAIVVTNSSGKFAAAAGVTSGTLSYLQGLSTNVQTALTSVAITTGSHTPNIGDGTVSFSVSSANGFWQKWGSLVYVELAVTWTSKGSTTSSAAVQVSLPFATAFPGNLVVGKSQWMASADQSNNYVTLYSGASPVPISDLPSSGSLQVSGVYRFA